MGKFAQAAAHHDISRRGDGTCVAGKWISDNLDEDDLVEFVRLAEGHKWHLITRLSDNYLKMASLNRHVHGLCTCFPGTTAKGCCSCNLSGDDS